MRSITRLHALVWLAGLVASSLAGASSAVERALDRIYAGSALHHVQRPQAVDGQRAGYYTGGRLSVRQRVESLQPVTVQVPSVRAGCGGIDIFTGGLSFAKSEELVRVFKEVANNAKSYAFMLAVESLSPMVADLMKTFQEKANAFNQFNINSCEMSAALVGGLWPKTQASQQKVCETLSASTGHVVDWAKGRQACANAAQHDAVLMDAKADPTLTHHIPYHTNVVWEALHAHVFWQQQPDTVDWLLSMTGTVVFDSPAVPPVFYPSRLVADPNGFDALLEGGPMSVYQCGANDPGCLHPESREIIVPREASLTQRVVRLLRAMAQKIQRDQPLTPEEMALLSQSALPLYKMLDINALINPNGDVLGVARLADIIAIDLLLAQVNTDMARVESLTRTMTYPEAAMSRLLAQMHQVVALLHDKQRVLQAKHGSMAELLQETRFLEKSLTGRLSSQLRAMTNGQALTPGGY